MELLGKWYIIERNIKTNDLKISKIKETEKKADKTFSSFISITSHHLKTYPLTWIKPPHLLAVGVTSPSLGFT